jgi:hypothetical protein
MAHACRSRCTARSRRMSRKGLLPPAVVLLFAIASPALAQRRSKETKFYGELEPRLYTSPELMSKAVFGPIGIGDANQLGAAADAGDKIYSGEFSLPDGGQVRNIYKAVIVRATDGKDVLYVDENRDGRFEPDERILFLPVVDPKFSRLKDMASFSVALPPGGAFRTCPMDAALARNDAEPPAKSPQIAVEYTSAPYVQGYAALADRPLRVRFQYDFEIGGVSVSYGYEWLDLNFDGKFDMSPGSPEFLHGNGSSPAFQADGMTLQVESVLLSRDQFVLRQVPRAPVHKHWHLPFQK